MKKIITAFLSALLLPASLVSCMDNGDTDKYYTVTFDTEGGSPVPEPQTILHGGYAVEPQEEITRGSESFLGWYSATTGLKFNFVSNPITKNMTLKAKYWAGPKKYIVINDYDWAYDEKTIYQTFGDAKGKDVAVGEGVLMYIFQRDNDVNLNTIKRHCEEAEKYNVPVLFQFDPITFWDGVPELWNWFDPSLPGYDESNRENVEWYGWSSEQAVKIGWLNWGRQIRLKPMANLFSDKYQAAVKERMGQYIGTVKKWYDSLPDEKKYLLIGIKITGELGVGVNNWYYAGGNDLYDKPESEDPQSGINMYNKPSRSNGHVATIGYAGVSSAGIKTSGEITGADIAELEKRYTLWLSKYVMTLGFPREMIFAHAGGVDNDLEACINDLVCPSWSFYGSDATDPRNATYCMDLLEHSDTPYWGIAEWAISSNDPNSWEAAVNSAFSLDRCRFLSMYCNVIGNNNGTTMNSAAIQGIKLAQTVKY